MALLPLPLLPMLLLLQFMPPPLSQLAASLMFGRAHATEQREVPVPEPRLQFAPAEDCQCGVPASPRGPR
jgi:hypothetical protein